MTATLLQFGLVMLIVMIGFAMAIHVLLLDVDSFGETLLGLFKAMLGEVDFFQRFSGGPYDRVATILVIMYLFIVTIMLLNLLVAILSTAHAQVQENLGGEFKVSKARIVAHYRWVVEKDILPAPFNLFQTVFSLGAVVVDYLWNEAPCLWGGSFHGVHGANYHNNSNDRSTILEVYSSASGAFGRVLFWLVLGPVAVGAGALLWISSCFPYAQYAWYDHFRGEKKRADEESRGSIMLRWSLLFLWCAILAPICLLGLWVKASHRVLFGESEKHDESNDGNGGSLLMAESDEGSKEQKDPDDGNGGDLFFGKSKEQKGPDYGYGGSHSSKVTIESMLRNGPNGVGADKLRVRLEDPMNDDDVRQDEKTKPTMVEHIKLLRNRLETTTKEELRNNVASKSEVTELRNDVKTS